MIKFDKTARITLMEGSKKIPSIGFIIIDK